MRHDAKTCTSGEQSRALIRSSKKRSWTSYVSGINKPESLSTTMWKDIKRLSGNSSFHMISQLKTNSQILSSPPDIAELLAKHFANTSSDNNYDNHFLTHKNQSESTPTNFDTNEDHSYNRPISLPELHLAIHKNLRNASPGPDKIHASMLKNPHPNSLSYLLSLFNTILIQNTYPLPWKLAIILPILKPQKDPSLPDSYRPIALTSVLGKLFQKILNKRLIWYLEHNNIISPFQYGFRKGRNTLQALIDLQQQINDATTANATLYTIFFDLQQAFPRVWRHYICQKLHQIGLRGNLPKLLQSFLQERTITVRIQDQLSSHHIIQNGIPQGDVWSVPLFLIAINDITKCVAFPLTQRLFADDFSISLQSSHPHRAARLLQHTLDKISSWSSDRGYRFSSQKTGLVIFKKHRRRLPLIPPLLLQGFTINTFSKYKFLGLTFDHKLSWTPHIKILKAKCVNTLKIIKYLSHPRIGCNRKLLLQLYKSLIRSQLDYGSPIYTQACKSTTKLLDSIQTSALRLSLGAFRTSPHLSLCAEAGEPTLHFRSLAITANFLASAAQFTHLPIYTPIITKPNP